MTIKKILDKMDKERKQNNNDIDDFFSKITENLDKDKTLDILDKILKGEIPKPGSYRGRVNNEPENNRKTLLDVKNA